MSKFQWNFYKDTSSFMQENQSENVVCKTAAILFRRQCVNVSNMGPSVN